MKKVILGSTLLAVLLTVFSFDMNAEVKAVVKEAKIDLGQPELWGADYLAQVIEFDIAALKNALTSFKKDHPKLYSKYFNVTPEIPTIPATPQVVLGGDAASRSPVNLITNEIHDPAKSLDAHKKA